MKTILIATALLAPAPAFAAKGDVGCIETKLGPTVMQRIGDRVVVAIDQNGQPAATLDADREALLAARESCRSINGWSSAAVQAATSYMQARAALLGVEAALKREGIDPLKLQSSYTQLAVEDRRSLTDSVSPSEPTAAAIKAIIAASPRAGVRLHAFAYFMALSGIEFYPADFAAG